MDDAVSDLIKDINKLRLELGDTRSQGQSVSEIMMMMMMMRLMIHWHVARCSIVCILGTEYRRNQQSAFKWD